MAFPLHIFPGQVGSRPADVAGLLRRGPEPVTSGTVLQDQSSLVDGIPEGLAQGVGDRVEFRHRVTPNSAQPTARTRGIGSRRIRYMPADSMHWRRAPAERRG